MKEKLEKLTEVIKDESLAKELLSMKDPEDAQKWIKAHGVDMTLDEVRELGGTLKELLSGKTREELEKMAAGEYELTNDELKQVSGGEVVAIVGLVVCVLGTVAMILDKAGVFDWDW